MGSGSVSRGTKVEAGRGSQQDLSVDPLRLPAPLKSPTSSVKVPSRPKQKEKKENFNLKVNPPFF